MKCPICTEVDVVPDTDGNIPDCLVCTGVAHEAAEPPRSDEGQPLEDMLLEEDEIWEDQDYDPGEYEWELENEFE